MDALEPYNLIGAAGRKKITSFMRDGCPANGNCIASLRSVGYNMAMDIKCISHASSNVGKALYASCSLATKFINKFNYLMNTSCRSRSAFRTLIKAEVKRYSSDIRWFYQQEVSSQIYKYFSQVQNVINSEPEIGKETKNSLSAMIDADCEQIHLELALLEDIAPTIAKLCYYQEGDGFLVPTTYDHWNECLQFLHQASQEDFVLKEVSSIADIYHPDGNLEDTIFTTRSKITSCLEKMNEDTRGRLKDDFVILRACRLFNYNWLGQTTIMSLYHKGPHDDVATGEIFKLMAFPTLSNDEGNLMPFIDELESYRTLATNENAKEEDQRLSIIDFWRKHALALPTFSTLIPIIGTLMPSSATVERLFSILSSFQDNQANARGDYVKASCMIRYNENFRSKY
jgi:hypothetical protein